MIGGVSPRAQVLVAGGLVVAGLVVFVLLAPHLVEGLLGDGSTLVLTPDGEVVTLPACLIRRVPGGEVVFESMQLLTLRIPPERTGPEYEMLLTGRGCGLLRGPVVTDPRITLPPPIHVTVVVAGTFPLPRGDMRLGLTFEWAGADADLARVLDRAPAPTGAPPFPAEGIDIDPDSRAVRVSLPCPGPWRITWMHVTRGTLGIVFAQSETTVTIAGDAERHELAIDPALLDGGFRETEKR